jgi:hypothetical protein
VVHADDKQEKLEGLARRGITLVRVHRVSDARIRGRVAPPGQPLLCSPDNG